MTPRRTLPAGFRRRSGATSARLPRGGTFELPIPAGDRYGGRTTAPAS